MLAANYLLVLSPSKSVVLSLVLAFSHRDAAQIYTDAHNNLGVTQYVMFPLFLFSTDTAYYLHNLVLGEP